MSDPTGSGAEDDLASIWWELPGGTDRPRSRHLWTPVTSEQARDWPDARLRTTCGVVMPREVVARASEPAIAETPAGPEPALCRRCARIRASRAERPS